MTATLNPSVKLYELAAARDILDEFLAETEGEVTPELQQLLDELTGDTKEKIERVALYVREQLVTAKAIDDEANRLAQRAAAKRKAAEGLKSYLKVQMERLGLATVDGLLATVALQKNPPSVKGEVDAAALWDVHSEDTIGIWRPLLRYVPESIELDRKAALAAFKAGNPLPVGLTVEQGTSLRIK